MKRCILNTCTALAAVGTLMLTQAIGEEKPVAGKPDPKMEEMMKKAEAASTPGAAHKALEPLVGDWNAEVTLWMEPDKPATVTKGTSRNSWTLKGRFVQQEFDGEFMGKPFQGVSFTGYDNVRQRYSSVWIDDMSTAMVTSEGDASDGGKVITFEGTYACAMTGEKNKAIKQVYRIVSRDKHVFEMYDPAQDNRKTMEIVYTRK